jgi:hypothetical protein
MPRAEQPKQISNTDGKSTAEQVFGSEAMKWAIIAVPIVIAWLQFVFKDDITRAWPFFHAWPGFEGTAVLSVILYWTLIPVSVALIYYHGWAKDREARRLRALPDGRYLSDFARRICDGEDRLAKAPRIAKADLAELLELLRSLLEGVAVLAATYDYRPGARYAANVMFFVSREQFPGDYTLLLYGKTKEKLDKLQGVLLLSQEFSSAAHGDGHVDPLLGDVALPVPGADLEGKIHPVLPGAPKVYLQQVAIANSHRMRTDSVDDVSKMELEGLGFDQNEVREIRDYFSESGSGRAVKSFMSFPLFTNEQKLFGVLNIHSSRTDWVGGGDDRQQYCSALLMPLVNSVGNVADAILQAIRGTPKAKP